MGKPFEIEDVAKEDLKNEPFEIEDVAEEDLKNEMRRIYLTYNEGYGVDITILNENDDDITESQFINEIVADILEEYINLKKYIVNTDEIPSFVYAESYREAFKKVAECICIMEEDQMNKKEQKIIKEIMRRNDLNVVYYDDLEEDQMIDKEYHRSWRLKKKSKSMAVKMSIIELFKEYDPISEDLQKLINLLSLV